jgi:hypothetical protein
VVRGIIEEMALFGKGCGTFLARESLPVPPDSGSDVGSAGSGRRAGGGNVVGDLLTKGGLRAGLDPVAAADIDWVLDDPGPYHQFVHERGWTHTYYRARRADPLAAQLLPFS